MPIGFKYGREARVGLILSEKECVVAGVTTTNKCAAAPVIYSRQILDGGRASAIVVNSGNANACTGEQGLKAAREMAFIASRELGLEQGQVIVASTGKIGVPLDMETIRNDIVAAGYELSRENIDEVAQAILTTDTRTKKIEVDLGDAKIVGIAKGSGMIHPDMATMLAFIMTDAKVEHAQLQKALEEAVSISFNMITVDGDTSTNDMCVVLANGMAGKVSSTVFLRGLVKVCTYLAKEIARDGEGATKLFKVQVNHAESHEEAVSAAKTIAGSPLVKTAVHGADPNWGRVAAAIGRSGALIDPDTIAIKMEDLESEAPKIIVDLNMGESSAIAWGCDLTKGYIDINTKYN
ncbi:bifunctional glutamate N-acetyltransferase/amino-acid acetyltransferase ArgJ [Candidatus Margulisiibacteriota bacterium]